MEYFSKSEKMSFDHGVVMMLLKFRNFSFRQFARSSLDFEFRDYGVQNFGFPESKSFEDFDPLGILAIWELGTGPRF